MIALTLAGCALGAAVFWLVVLLRPPKVDPLTMLARFDAARADTGPSAWDRPGTAASAGVVTRMGQWLNRQLAVRGIAMTTLRQDVALTGKSFDAVLGRKILVAVTGFVIGLVLVVAASAAGLSLPFGAPIVVALLVAGVFFFIPDVDARTEAAKRRKEFRRALAAYLDWVSLQMAGKAAAEQALPEATMIGGGWPLALLRHTVTNAPLAHQDVWTAFTELGQRIGVPQLQELGTLVQLVAHDGAQVRDTLSARAASLRNEELAEAEGTAGKRDQSMLMAQILLGIGFAVFLGYPAVVNFLSI